MSKLTHIDSKGQARMVDVGGKPDTLRTAVATCQVRMKAATLALITGSKIRKGDVLATARVAGIMGAKSTPNLIPLCHPLNITSAEVDLKPVKSKNVIKITACVSTVGPTGVEMEALTAASIAALTVYDMCKAVDKEMVITETMLVEKKGGRSGHYKRPKS